MLDMIAFLSLAGLFTAVIVQTMRKPDAPRPEPPAPPVAMLLWCPGCGRKHVDRGEWSTRPHRDHFCESCGYLWRPSMVFTVGVDRLEEPIT